MIKTLLIEGSELTLEKPINVDELMVNSHKLQQAHATLKARFKALGDTEDAADAAATREIEGFLSKGLGKLGDAFVAGKRALLEKLVEIQTKIHGLYRDVMRGRGAVRFDVDALRANYREMQAVFDELAKPLEDVAASTAKTGSELEGKPIEEPPTKVPAGKTVVTADVRFGTLKSRKGFKAFLDVVTGKSGWRAKLKSGIVEFFVEDGKLSVRSTRKGEPTVTFKEFDTLGKYKDKPLSTRVMQAHHGCQSKLMEALFGDAYDPQEAPTIWLRDSTGDSPHGLITHAMQNPNEDARLADPDLSYGKIRDWAVGDLKRAGAPDTSIREYLAAMDSYFKTNIEPSLTEAQKVDSIGTIKAH